VSGRLKEELSLALPNDFELVVWSNRKREFGLVDGRSKATFSSNDWILTPELFSGEERNGFDDFRAKCPAKFAAIFHDAIPLKYPEITWPHSVGRHPSYMKLLASFDLVLSVSNASRADLIGYWDWLGISVFPEIKVLQLGSNLIDANRVKEMVVSSSRDILLVAILEPRKNQEGLLAACERLWERGVEFSVTFVGRVNPHFGKPIQKKIKALEKRGLPICHLPKVSDSELAALYQKSRFTVYPSLTEGCGLPVLESLWFGRPCVCSDIPAVQESAEGGGCVLFSLDNPGQLEDALHSLLTNESRMKQLEAEVNDRVLPTWRESAQGIVDVLQLR
jgi:glycosyltransferase involved in cell wall biosynthesis